MELKRRYRKKVGDNYKITDRGNETINTNRELLNNKYRYLSDILDESITSIRKNGIKESLITLNKERGERGEKPINTEELGKIANTHVDAQKAKIAHQESSDDEQISGPQAHDTHSENTTGHLSNVPQMTHGFPDVPMTYGFPDGSPGVPMLYGPHGSNDGWQNPGSSLTGGTNDTGFPSASLSPNENASMSTMSDAQNKLTSLRGERDKMYQQISKRRKDLASALPHQQPAISQELSSLQKKFHKLRTTILEGEGLLLAAQLQRGNQ